jgi:hypothetical protein
MPIEVNSKNKETILDIINKLNNLGKCRKENKEKHNLSSRSYYYRNREKRLEYRRKYNKRKKDELLENKTPLAS